jgi:uncharacterized damage-inducible protein DinB
MTTDLRYPIGKFNPPSGWTPGHVAEWVSAIASTPAGVRSAVNGLSEAQLDTPYRPDGWTVRQVVHHLVDSHINSYCRFRLALTEDNPTIKPYDQKRWAELVDARTAPIEPSLTMLDALHLRWVLLLEELTPADLERTFNHPERERPMPLWRNLALYAWHGRHHTAHITALRAREGW